MRPLILAAVLSLAAAPAIAGQAVTLKSETLDGDGLITLSDLFDGAGASGRIAVATRPGTTAVLDAGAVQLAARRAGLDWANAEGIRRIVVRAGADGGSSPLAVRGNVEVLTYARSLSAGEMVQPQDVVWAKAAAAPMDAPRDADAVIGMAAKRPLRAGAAVSVRDVSAPQVIRAGDAVMVVYEAGGVSLSLEGKAMGVAGIGDTVAVQNTASKKIIQATASGPGQAVVGPAAGQLKSLGRAQYAQR
ncbi:MAG: flagellar basal body P-ring formation protein FlgA [Phenylobacterium sp.]|uniref:flagellar basal body P-ring formation chaperone FlgA n=1 Tax=Phenylobacterium sp. TaxID=1871053 RepID=UPI001B516D3B|nr:flagellar basal body P-ring formation chaperone FlgA [Phenylobacterium sp.]MBP7651398.1 flagellar basal body P-ring formation protein FlgA [Phenylobacterium sp.]MBP7815635.1 flagellar basal body P-ring formation protein FlgA [Phenylobacterium sp.]MBP9229897.1 flagellar basal body P-ring formation protein FlgA [Phenylobacterium sp.]MBP9754181.1 flagellar basal body P-ring formation protein FlgA [Phenylobacterium sp.]